MLSMDEWEGCREEVERIDWDEYFILQAYLASIRSMDAQTQCGAVIIKDCTIISTGYNSFIGGINDSILPNTRPKKYPWMIHAEKNAILNCAANGNATKGATVYVTGVPCADCFQDMHQAKIKEVKYYSNHSIHMCATDEQKKRFGVLLALSPMKLTPLVFDDKFSYKIDQIKSCR